MIANKTIFISALDWGLGHATRSVPIIKSLQKNNTIIIGVTPLTQTIFDEEFPELQKIQVPAYNIKYSKKMPISLKLFLDAPKILNTIKKEKNVLEELITKHKIDVVISDNRFGLHSKKAHCIFITHQLFLKTDVATKFAQNINKNYILNFNEVWIPDEKEELKSLSGDLSHGIHFHKNVKYIGTLSRLEKTISIEKPYDYLFLISGPEPQQSIFANLLIKKAELSPNLKFALVSPNNQKPETRNIETFISPNAKKLSQVIEQSKKIICRSGYSTLMDLQKLKVDFKNIILVPTPGQTEQEYLANYLKHKFGAKLSSQNELNHYTFAE